MSQPNVGLERINETVAVRIGLASPEDILGWSSGEVTRPETLNYRSLRPERGGLFCERIFGPERDFECGCGKYRGVHHKGQICDHCGVQVNHSRVRRKRMGHIELACPVVHCWYFRNTPNRLASLLGIRPSSLARIVYYQDHVVVNPGTTGMVFGQILDETAHKEARETHGDTFELATGAVAVEEMLRRLNLDALAAELRQQLLANEAGKRPSESRGKQLMSRLQTVEAMRKSGNRPEWLVLRRIAVIPPDLRPIVMLGGGNFASSDLNDLYRRVLSRNIRLKRLIQMHAPEVILRCERRMLQQAVDALFDNSRNARPILSSNGARPLKSLTEMLAGKQGRFRENLLGKRVDYSARSVIVVGPELKLHQCGLPRKIALELFQPFLVKKLRERGLALTLKRARTLLAERSSLIWGLLEEVMRGHPVLLNRAPTLHRMSIQAFEPLLCEGNAIRLHPLVCKAFNADFDGDALAVHLPLSLEAQVEARVLMMPTANILSPAGGQPIISPSQDIVLGCSYLTCQRQEARGKRQVKSFSGPSEVILAHSLGKVHLHDAILVRLREGKPVSTTVGRVLFNDILSEGMPFYNEAMTAAALAKVVAECQQRLGRQATVELLDRIKALGFRSATQSGLSFAVDDLKAPPGKEAILRATEKGVAKVNAAYQRGDVADGDRQRKIIDLWTAARDRITDDLLEAMADDEQLNPVLLMAQSGARGGKEPLRQLAGMRGLIAKPSGEVLETPIRSSFREGLSVAEYFASTHGARKGLADTALKTAEAGYLTRKLVDVAQNVVVTEDDCGSRKGLLKQTSSICGRVSSERVRDGEGNVLVKRGELLREESVQRLEEAGLSEVRVRSPLMCQAALGVCRLCYGTDLSTGRLVETGTAVGVIAAQSIGEPGTQLTMRTFHVGGVHSQTDITRGLPRVNELFEAWKPEAREILHSQGLEAAANYLLREILAVYRQQSVRLDDRHVEIILGQMLSRVRVLSCSGASGDTSLLPGAVIERRQFDRINSGLKKGRVATCEPVLLGISRAAVQSDSFISAASFQETTRVLTSAALAGRTDPLVGLKENVILGRLIPAGTGFRTNREARLSVNDEDQVEPDLIVHSAE